MSIPLSEIVTLLDSTLRIAEIKDASVAMNGLQVENNGSVTKVALGVDGSQKTIDDAIAAGADLLVLHHGIFWCGLQPIKGWWKQKVETCLKHNLAIYSAHLPLDLHPQLGNNAGIARALELQDVQPEVDYHGTLIGLSGIFPGTVVQKFTAPAGVNLKVPHMGWNSVEELSSPLFDGLNEGDFVYFVHSYYVPASPLSIATTEYGGVRFSSAMRCGNFYATQFHPEKSGEVGERIIRNFIYLCHD